MVDDPDWVQKQFVEGFHWEDRETRWATLQIASTLPNPNPYLYSLISNAARDSDMEIREAAKSAIIRLNRIGFAAD